jgi:hypothetical protein
VNSRRTCSGDALLAPSITRRLVERVAPDASVQPVVHAGPATNIWPCAPQGREILALGRTCTHLTSLGHPGAVCFGLGAPMTDSVLVLGHP